MEVIISSPDLNFSEDLFTIGPLNFEDFSAKILDSSRKCLFLRLDIEIVKKFLNLFSKRLMVVDKILNFLNGMGLRT